MNEAKIDLLVLDRCSASSQSLKDVMNVRLINFSMKFLCLWYDKENESRRSMIFRSCLVLIFGLFSCIEYLYVTIIFGGVYTLFWKFVFGIAAFSYFVSRCLIQYYCYIISLSLDCKHIFSNV